MTKREQAQEAILDAIIKHAKGDFDGDITLQLAKAWRHLHPPMDWSSPTSAPSDAEQAEEV